MNCTAPLPRSRAWWSLLFLMLVLAPSCGEDAGDSSTEPELTPEQHGLVLCCRIGDTCHPGSEDPIGGLVRQCHDLGHQNDPDLCRARYDECLAACSSGRQDVSDGEHGCTEVPAH